MVVDDLLLSCAGIGRADVGLGVAAGSDELGFPPAGKADLGLADFFESDDFSGSIG